MAKKAKGKMGSSFEDFLKEEGIYEGVTAYAEKRVLAWQIQEAMKAQKITKQKMADRMHTSRTQVDRLLDPKNDKVSLEIIHRAASAVGKRVRISLEDGHINA
jgi:predicted XRE-type DNA-binding protein